MTGLDEPISDEPRKMMMLDFLLRIKQTLKTLYSKSNTVPYYAGAYRMFNDDEQFRNEILAGVCDDIAKDATKYQQDNDYQYQIDGKQIAIELGYYFRHDCPFTTASQKTQYNALAVGTFEWWFSDMCISRIGWFLKDVDWKTETPERIWANYFGDEPASLRSVISLGEQLLPYMGQDFLAVIGMGKKAVKAHIQLATNICNADWYWEGVALELLEDIAETGCEPFDESDGVSKTDSHEYLDEWMWDIIATQFGWGALDFEELGNWGCHDSSFQIILQRQLVRMMGQTIKQDYFPSEDATQDWQRDNQ